MNTIIMEASEKSDEQDNVFDIYQKLASDRILFITDHINDKVASDIVALFLLKDSENQEDKISLIINSDGGDIRNVFSIYDMMKMVESPIETICTGAASDEAVLLLSAGTPGMRFATKNSLICPKELAHDSMIQSSLTDVKKFMDRVKKDNDMYMLALSSCIGKKVPVLKKDFQSHKFFTAKQAVSYGFIDKVI